MNLESRSKDPNRLRMVWSKDARRPLPLYPQQSGRSRPEPRSADAPLIRAERRQLRRQVGESFRAW